VHALAVLHLLPGPRARACGPRWPAAGVRGAWLDGRAGPGPAGPGDVRAVPAGLGRGGQGGPPRRARLAPPLDRPAPRPPGAVRPAAGPGTDVVRRGRPLARSLPRPDRRGEQLRLRAASRAPRGASGRRAAVLRGWIRLPSG